MEDENWLWMTMNEAVVAVVAVVWKAETHSFLDIFASKDFSFPCGAVHWKLHILFKLLSYQAFQQLIL